MNGSTSGGTKEAARVSRGSGWVLVLFLAVLCLIGLRDKLARVQMTPAERARVEEIAQALAHARQRDFLVLPGNRIGVVVYHHGPDDLTVVLQTCLACPTQRRTLQQLAEVGATLIVRDEEDPRTNLLVAWWKQDYVPVEPF